MNYTYYPHGLPLRGHICKPETSSKMCYIRTHPHYSGIKRSFFLWDQFHAHTHKSCCLPRIPLQVMRTYYDCRYHYILVLFGKFNQIRHKHTHTQSGIKQFYLLISIMDIMELHLDLAFTQCHSSYWCMLF